MSSAEVYKSVELFDEHLEHPTLFEDGAIMAKLALEEMVEVK